MRIIPLIKVASVTTVLFFGLSQIASASNDWKGYAGANCMQKGKVNNKLHREVGGLINDSSTSAQVICPVVRDISAAGKPRVKAAHVVLKSYGKGRCSFYSLNHDGSIFASQNKTFGIGNPVEVKFTKIAASSWGSYTIACSIPGVSSRGHSSIRSYAVDEY